jgi:hypothetical protein
VHYYFLYIIARCNCDAICNYIEDFHFTMVYGVLIYFYVVYSCITSIFGAYVYRCLVSCIVDVIRAECGTILTLL